MKAKFVGRYSSVNTLTIIENSLTGFNIEPKAVSEKTIGNFKIFEKSEIYYPCK